MTESPKKQITNVNIGLFGHVDSGKTSLSKLISTHKSTAAFDKSNQSQERKITLDLGFSSVIFLKERVQVTLVDCPGHSNYIKTIMGGAQIVDGAIIVIDIVEGIQRQTLECSALCKMLSKMAHKNGRPFFLFFFLNKVDLLANEEVLKAKMAKIEKALTKLFLRKNVRKNVLAIQSVFRNNKNKEMAEKEKISNFILEKIANFCENGHFLDRSGEKFDERQEKFLMAFDHCFGVKGKGTVLTGTILDGNVKIGDKLYFQSNPNAFLKVKSIQKFHQNVPVQ
ncbi:hypothetical protein MHBO_001330 [Bonamia ostreae]|uniref:Tr-type G domain-containing protein n=1 Tax=Bonamia ostreae TaxID=126728 RepID=A0ABV2AIR1_9EUKA